MSPAAASEQRKEAASRSFSETNVYCLPAARAFRLVGAEPELGPLEPAVEAALVLEYAARVGLSL